MYMKNKIQYFATITLIALLSFSTNVMAQPDPGPGGDPGGGGPPVGGGAPIGGGTWILIVLGIAYAISRWYVINRQRTVQE